MPIDPIDLEDALVSGMTQLGTTHQLPVLRWSFERRAGGTTYLAGQASSGDYSDAEAGPAAEAWAAALSLSAVTPLMPGSVEFAGQTRHGLGVVVWGITDYNQFNREGTV